MRIVSGIQPTGNLHLGNYLGAIRNWVRMQDQVASEGGDCLFFLADLHAISMPHVPADLTANTRAMTAALVACGIDPDRSTLFNQARVPAHAELQWLLNGTARIGWLNRMTQFKDKGRGDERAGAGLFFYPVLMAADILLYDTNSVPVGEDQRQHLELTRDVAERFNAKFGETFVIPEADIQAEGARIMSLDDPTKKMSKSGAPGSYIAFQDTPSEIRKKIMRAVTDSGSEIVYREDKPAIVNLLTIYSQFSDEPIATLEERYAGAGYGQFKKDLADVVVSHMEPIQQRLAELAADPGELLRILDRGTERAREIATPKMERVREVTGITLFH